MRGVALAVALAGCLGGGGTASGPTDATVLFAVVDQNLACNTNGQGAHDSYLGGVAIGSTLAFIATASDAFGCGNDAASQSLLEVSLAGGDPGTSLGSIGPQPPQEAHVAAVGDTPVFAFAMANGGELQGQIGSAAAFGIQPPTGGMLYAADAVGDGSGAWIASWGGFAMMQGGFDDPGYPYDQQIFQPTGTASGGTLLRVGVDGTAQAVASLPANQSWACATMPDCLASDGSGGVLAIASETSQPGQGTLLALPAGATAFTAIEALTTLADGGPMGFASDGAHAAWVLADEPNGGQPHCVVVARDLAAGSDTQLLESTAFSCAGAAVDATGAYVAITTYGHGDQGNVIDGLGIGRVEFATGAFESIATGLSGEGVGARRLYVVGDTIYVVDPHVLAAIPVAALAGQHAFAP
jgi:hypothetical protein|nr:hypothetical protein [Kofleriaceae bacterium]